MIAKSYLLKSLETLEKLYNRSTSATEGLLCSKLAILELCGWIEESMDTIIRMCVHRKIKDQKVWAEIENSVIQRTWGFEYNNNFRKMLCQVIGWIGVIEVEKRLDPVKFQVLQAVLSKLKSYRVIEAHTHIKGTTKRLDAPSVTKANYLDVYEGLKDIDDKLISIGF